MCAVFLHQAWRAPAFEGDSVFKSAILPPILIFRAADQDHITH
jgi:hypothetical protein